MDITTSSQDKFKRNHKPNNEKDQVNEAMEIEKKGMSRLCFKEPLVKGINFTTLSNVVIFGSFLMA